MTAPLHLLLQGTLAPEQTLTYIHLPFDVPEGIGRIDVAYEYDSAIASDPTLTGGNTIDIGIFDWRGSDVKTQGYRGGSGSARSSFFIAHDSATPGYMPGPIQPGTWYICLGAYKVAPAGCHYRVTIKLTPAATAVETTFPTLLPLRDKPPINYLKPDGWYKGELHCHTVNSDGDSTPETIVQLAEKLELDFLAITDHNNQSHLAALNHIQTNLILIPGYEVTTYFGHWNIWGGAGWVDFRLLTAEDLRQAIAEAKKRGYLVSCNHPRPHGPDWAFSEVEDYDCVEIWNGPWELLNQTALTFWERRLAQGKQFVAVGGSDHHFSHREHIARLGQPTTYIYCEGLPSTAALLSSLRAGHAFITESPTGPQIDFRANGAMMGDRVKSPASSILRVDLHIRDAAGATLQLAGTAGTLSEVAVETNDLRLPLNLDTTDTSWIRAQLIDPLSGRIRAITNPIYIT